MKHLLILTVFVMLTLGCETENPICTDTYCITGEVFPRSELEEEQSFDEFPATVSEQELIDLLTVDVGEYTFEEIAVTGRVDWDFLDADWQYRENRITYLKKVILEFEIDEGRFGENRIILVHLNKDTVRRDANFREHVEFLGNATIDLTHHVGIAEFQGNIVGAPTK